MSYFLFLMLSVLIFAIGLIPGYLMLRAFTSCGEDEGIAMSFGLTFFILMMLSFAGYLLGTDQRLFNTISLTLFCFLLLCYVKVKRREFSIGKVFRSKFFQLFFIYYLLILSFQVLVTVYTGAKWYGDWWEHFARSQFYLLHFDYFVRYWDIYTIPSRLPLFNLNVSFFLSIFGDKFWIYQVVSSLLNASFFLGVYIVAKTLFNRKTAILASTIVGFSPFLIWNSVYPWPKVLAAYFVLLFIYCYVRLMNKNQSESLQRRVFAILLGLFIGLAYMSHQYALVYVFGIGIHFVFSKFLRLSAVLTRKEVLLSTIGIVGVLAPWHIWAFSIYGLRGTLFATPTLSAFASTGWVSTRIMNTLTTLIPLPLVDYLGTPSLIDFSQLHDYLLQFYFCTLPGALTVTLFGIILFVGILSLIPRSLPFTPAADSLIAILIIVGFVGGILVQPLPNKKGIANETMIPLLTLAMIYVAKYLSKLNTKRVIVILSFIYMELGISLWIHIYNLLTNHWWASAQDANYCIKTMMNLTFLYDYVGGYWKVHLVLAVICQFLLIYAFYIFSKQNSVEVKGKS